MTGLREKAKKLAAKALGVERPSAAAAQALVRARRPERYLLGASGRTPNNPALPLLVYRQVVSLAGWDPAAIFEVLFDAHQWRDSWRDGMFNYNHFHTRTHEVLGLARGTLTAVFGGAQGEELQLKAGDVVVIPAGVGHRRLRMSADLLIVGAYPADGRYDEPRPSEIALAKAAKHIAQTRLSQTDPVYGAKGGLVSLWYKTNSAA